jgi:hypothetical protein
MEIGKLVRGMYAAAAIGSVAVPAFSYAQEETKPALNPKEEITAKLKVDESTQLKIRELIGKDSSCLKASVVATYTSSIEYAKNLKFGDYEKVRMVKAHVEEPGRMWMVKFQSDLPVLVSKAGASIDRFIVTYTRTKNSDGEFLYFPLEVRYQDKNGKGVVKSLSEEFTCTFVNIDRKKELQGARPVHFASVGDLARSDAAKLLLQDARAIKK